jgi:xanthine dehydrogenase YagT iron-sulfur-binding subunit
MSSEHTAHLQPTVLNINGAEHELVLDTRATLLDVLRERLDLTGAKKGCDHGQCGACTVLLDGRRANACLLLAVTLDGLDVVTIEGLAGDDAPHPLQEAFVEHDAFQCGYCTPGQICSAAGVLDEARAEGVALDDDEIRERMSGNLCRCGAYVNIVAAIAEVAR